MHARVSACSAVPGAASRRVPRVARPGGGHARRLAMVLAALAGASFAAGPAPAARNARGAADHRPRVFVWSPVALVHLQARVRAGDPALAPAVAQLREEAEAALKRGPYAVTQKAAPPPSGDRHDYLSLGPYWWPDPSKPDGKPYIRRDGEVNPERSRTGDADRFAALRENVVTLALAWWYTADERYAEHAARLLRTWFLDAGTRMNPNMEFAQAIPGRCEGRGIGIVDAAGMIHLVDAVGLLEGSRAWRAADQRALQDWFARFLRWLTESAKGRDEDRTENNHATQYDAQVASYALFTGQPDLARTVLSNVPARRIATQIRSDGAQPRELSRTKSWDYSCGNTKNFVHLALLAEKLDLDLWRVQTRDGGSIRSAIDFLLPYAAGEQAWTHKQLHALQPDRLYVPLRYAAERDPDPRYRELLGELPGARPEARENLLYGPLP